MTESFLLDYIKKFHPEFSKSVNKISIKQRDLFQKGKKIDDNSTKIIEDLTGLLKNKAIIIDQQRKDQGDNPLFSIVIWKKWEQAYDVILLSTKTDFEKFNEREKIRTQIFKEQIEKRILGLTSRESVALINEVLGSAEKVIRNYKPGKPTRDGGIDFTAEFYLDKNSNITEKYGEWLQVYGQLKHLKGQMGVSAIRDLAGAIVRDNKKIKIGMIISSRGFSPDCEIEVSEQISSKDSKIRKIFLNDINFIIDLMLRYNIGLEKARVPASSFIDEEWWNEIKFSA